MTDELCEHEWEVAGGDWDEPANCAKVICLQCGMVGQHNYTTEETYWPAT